jgi:hypothetical protein
MSETATPLAPPAVAAAAGQARVDLARAAQENGYLTRGQLAGLLSVCPRTVSNWVKAGRLPGPLPRISGGSRGRLLWSAQAVYRALVRLEVEGEARRGQ